MNNIRIGWVGFHQEGVAAFNWCLENGFKPEIVVTLNEEAASKRSGEVTDYYRSACVQHDVPLLAVGNVNDPDCVEVLRKADLDVLIVLGWSQILRSEALATAKIGVVGAHASLLPRNRGSAPINWALIKGEKVTGNTLMWLSDEVDGGDVIAQQQFDITMFDTCDTLYEHVSRTNKDMIAFLLTSLTSGNVPRTKQQHSNEPLLPRRKPSDGSIDWNAPATQVYNYIRALTKPYPGAFSYLDGTKFLVWEAALLPGSENKGAPGEVVGPVYSPVPEACGIEVACKQGSVILHRIETGDTEIAGEAICTSYNTGEVFSHE